MRNIVHEDCKLRKASDYLEYDIHTLAAGIDIYLQYRGTEIGYGICFELPNQRKYSHTLKGGDY